VSRWLTSAPRDGHHVGPESKTNDEAVDAEGARNEKDNWSSRDRQCIRWTPSRWHDAAITCPAPRYDVDEPIDLSIFQGLADGELTANKLRSPRFTS
jgi:hypothetical protein